VCDRLLQVEKELKNSAEPLDLSCYKRLQALEARLPNPPDKDEPSIKGFNARLARVEAFGPDGTFGRQIAAPEYTAAPAPPFTAYADAGRVAGGSNQSVQRPVALVEGCNPLASRTEEHQYLNRQFLMHEGKIDKNGFADTQDTVALATTLPPAAHEELSKGIFDVNFSTIFRKPTGELDKLGAFIPPVSLPTFVSWLYCWGMYEESIKMLYPRLAKEIERYRARIVGMEQRYGFQLAVRYDSMYRARATKHYRITGLPPSFRIDPDVETAVFRGASPILCFFCQSKIHVMDDCPQLYGKTSSQAAVHRAEPPAKTSGGTCNNFNKGFACHKTPCSYLHVCAGCGSKEAQSSCKKCSGNKVTGSSAPRSGRP